MEIRGFCLTTKCKLICLVFHPAIIYHCDLTKDPMQPSIFREVTVKGFNPSDYQTTQVAAANDFSLL